MMIALEHVALTYQSPDGEIEALRDVSFEMEEGEFVSIVGPSGCGKSTLLSLISGLEPPTSGQILVDGNPVTAPSSRVGLMPQRDQLFEWRTIWGNVTLGLELRGERDRAAYDRARELLEQYGLGAFAQKRPSQLSGGMRQRCALIRTMATQPRILLLDEPFSALDYQTRLSVSADIHAIIRQEHKTALLVTHDISEAISLSDRVVVLSRRPAVVKSIHDLGALRDLAPMERRDAPAFRTFFNSIWKELDKNA
ncbi:ABC transporter ATP-binding protein [Oscillibacter ruminantium]|jgi:NitT/TauT family transport system ATP-binding protein|uniref:ABC transporter ATP-binding protein n=1 Tax=Oscillibacter ruminantium TaxID=1263547 RepID=UPI00031562A7|nr:ABC transporter ATP-binding protein [Oscillibacter ruminantium]MDN0033648.1 ABC transporter ATP-binding protein [Oscillibacter valericigenes]